LRRADGINFPALHFITQREIAAQSCLEARCIYAGQVHAHKSVLVVFDRLCRRGGLVFVAGNLDWSAEVIFAGFFGLLDVLKLHRQIAQGDFFAVLRDDARVRPEQRWLLGKLGARFEFELLHAFERHINVRRAENPCDNDATGDHGACLLVVANALKRSPERYGTVGSKFFRYRL